ncbi:MAG: hypothetical protein M1819_005377 [Sarea resinae]|nr:MAG: hypothetical protein M1819_005377 [Sarea resinae]
MSNHPSQVAIADLAPEHLVAIEIALTNILWTDLAFETFSQIVDGNPIRDVYHDYHGNQNRLDLEQNLVSSPEARQVVESFRKGVQLDRLVVDAQVAQAYQKASIRSREFALRLMEMVAVTCHDIATSFFINADGGLHKVDPTRLPGPPRHPDLPPLMPISPKPTELYHPEYMDYDQYPNGVADIVGYWAEYRLFGGVILFDRGESGAECNDVFIHPVQYYRVYKLSDAQIQDFVNFLSSKSSSDDKPYEQIRFRAEKYALRIDSHEAMSRNIYRNKYERRIPANPPRRCVYHGSDFPELADAMADFVRHNP